MERCNPWEKDSCPLAQVCGQQQVAALFGRAAINNDLYCDEDKQGSTCGPITSYYEAAFVANSLRQLDADSPWTANARVVELPDGEAPEEVRQALVGISFPVRQNLQPEADSGITAVHPLDFILTLDNKGKLNEAQWYREYAGRMADAGQGLQAWHFNAADMKLDNFRSPRSLLSEFGCIPWMKSFLGVAHTGYVLEPALFHPKGDIDSDKFYERLREVADAEYDGDISVAIAYRMIGPTFEHLNLNAINDRFDYSVTQDSETGEVVRIVDHGRLVYDLDAGVDFRDHPEDAEPLSSKFITELPFLPIVHGRMRSPTYYDQIIRISPNDDQQDPYIVSY